MPCGSKKFIAIAIVVADIVSAGVMMTPASAETAAQERREIKRQQQVILLQQKQIQENQRQLQVQQRQIARQPGAPNTAAGAGDQNLSRGLFGNVGGCPLGYTYSLFYGCLPHVIVN